MSSAKGGFWVGGTFYYGMNGSLYRRSFDGATFGTPSKVDPYHDATWDTVETGSAKTGESQTYVGSASNFYAEIPGVTGMFYKGGRLYYTLAGGSSLYWRWFTPDSGTVGAERFTYMTSAFFAGSGGVFTADNSLYVVRQTTGNLEKMTWPTDPSAAQFSNTVSGPAVDGVDWRGSAVFVGP